jgi:hypothetical protein
VPAVAQRADVPGIYLLYPLGCYFSQLFSGINLPPEIHTERLSDGGLRMIAVEERLESDIHVRRAQPRRDDDRLHRRFIAMRGNEW